MRSALRSLRFRFAALTFAAIYLPVIVLFSVVRVQDTSVEVENGTTLANTVVDSGPSTAVIVTMVILVPFAVALAWWLSGIAVRPVTAAIEVQRRLVEEASHELRTPLAVLSNNAEVLMAHPEPDLQIYREGIERSGLAAARMQETIAALLVDARGRARVIDRKSTDLTRLCASVVRDLAGQAEDRGVAVRLISSGTVLAAVDEPSVKRAVTNLVTNAINHGEATTVDVEVSFASGGGGKEAVVIVSDDGAGIPPEDQDLVFDRFWTASRDGTGLGLAIARQIAEAHGGSLHLESPLPEGQGTRFTLSLRS